MNSIDDSILDEMRNALLRVDKNVFFGSAARLPKNEDWSFTVLRRLPSNHSNNGTSIGIRYEVSVVRPGAVPLEMISKIKDAMCSIHGVKWSENGSLDYDYLVKPNTSDTYESMSMVFTKVLKL